MQKVVEEVYEQILIPIKAVTLEDAMDWASDGYSVERIGDKFVMLTEGGMERA